MLWTGSLPAFMGVPGAGPQDPRLWLTQAAAWALGHHKAGHGLSHQSPLLPDGAGPVLPEQQLAGLEDGEPLQDIPRLTA